MVNRFVLNETSYHGAGAIKSIADEAKGRAFKKAFVCSDPDLVKFGVTQKVLDVLEGAGLDYELYSNIKPNPTIENVQTGVAACKAAGADYIIAIGGGSSMDTAKGVGIIMENPDFADVRSLEGVADTKHKSMPIFAVPTTAGTAAEVTINYVITDVEKNRKMVCVDPHDIPVVAFIDPEMMSSMPKGLTAATGMDALTHAIEGYITAGAWELSDMFHLKAIEIISRSLRGAVDNTPEGRAVQSKYGKILHASRPEPPHNHPRMPMSNRAKIFSPFAALRGYEDEIASEGRDHLKGNRIELSEEGKEALNQKISQLWKGQEISIKYFTDGYYEGVVGVLDAVDAINKELRIYTGSINDTGKELPTIIAFEDILQIGVNMT